ncbi:MAG TPA: hypothetical protein VIF62_21260 [Labilithrix sp.]|jgi:hypothetical protein
MAADICISCRTLLRDGETCEGKKHHTVSLGTPSGRGALDDEVWGPDSRARTMRKMAKAGATGGATGGLFQGCGGGCDGVSGCGDLAGSGEGILIVLAIVVFALAGIVIWWLAKKIYEWWRDRPKPQGAMLAPPSVKGKRVQCAGIVKSGKSVALPWRDGEALAYAFELHEKRVFGGGAMLREARTGRLEIALDDGRTLRVPEGRVHLVANKREDEVSGSRLREYLAEVGAKKQDDDRDLFPYDLARSVTLAPGDRVEVMGEVELTSDTAQEQGYRANAAIVAPVGVPVLRVKRDAPRVRVAGPTPLDVEEDEPESAGKRLTS